MVRINLIITIYYNSKTKDLFQSGNIALKNNYMDYLINFSITVSVYHKPLQLMK